MASPSSLNYKHLRYFWVVAKSGSITRATDHLHLTPQAISGQLSGLEESLGVELFRRAGRGIELTEAGRRVLAYADRIFTAGDELLEMLRAQPARTSVTFRIGLADSVQKSLAYRVVEPALRVESVRLICREGRLSALLAELAVHRLDLVIADRPMPSNLNARGYSHLLGESPLTVFGTRPLIKGLKGKFPALLSDAPFLLPGEDAAVRPKLVHWFEAQDVRPNFIGEFDDSALLKAFGQAGAGLFVAPTAVAEDVTAHYGAHAIGEIDSVLEQLYAITTERKLTHPAIVAISRAAELEIFGESRKRESIRRKPAGRPA